MKKSPANTISSTGGSTTTPAAETKASNGRRATATTHASTRGTRPIAPSPTRATTPGNGHENDAPDAEQILIGLIALKKGDFQARLPLGWTGMSGKIADNFNEVAEMMSRSTDELSRISRVVGNEGRIQERLPVGHAPGQWSERVKSVNTLIDCLAHPVSETAR